MDPISIHWFRNDLRTEDNPALGLLASQEKLLVGLYVFEDDENTAQKVWLHASLQDLEFSLKKFKIPLIFAYGSALDCWKHLLKHNKIERVSWSTCFEPEGIKRDKQVAKLLSDHKIPVSNHNSTHLIKPTDLSNGSGDFYKVFTPYYEKHQKVYEIPKPAKKITGNTKWPRLESTKIKRLNDPLIPLSKEWEPGENGAHKRLKKFIRSSLKFYEKGRDYPAAAAHSGLSPHLHFGEISPHALVRSCPNKAFIRELVFRDFAMQLLYHIPTLPSLPMKPQFSKWRWSKNSAFFEAWKKGKTGYPIVDAGMRELFETGFMHNRVRMIVASFLVKDLNIAWQKGADWFLERLLDADLANNSFNWQWCAGTGPDAQPFFRIFNPVLQSRKFDPEGAYIKKWVPELRNLSSKALHTPINPIVDHDITKRAALKEFKRVS